MNCEIYAGMFGVAVLIVNESIELGGKGDFWSILACFGENFENGSRGNLLWQRSQTGGWCSVSEWIQVSVSDATHVLINNQITNTFVVVAVIRVVTNYICLSACGTIRWLTSMLFSLIISWWIDWWERMNSQCLYRAAAARRNEKAKFSRFGVNSRWCSTKMSHCGAVDFAKTIPSKWLV